MLLAREAGVGRGSPGGRASLGAAHGLGLGHGIRGQFSTWVWSPDLAWR